MKHFSLFFLLLTLGGSAFSQTAPFHRGVNLTNWFQASHPGAIQFGKYTKRDFENIKSLGCDVIRLPINLHAMTYGEPDYIPDPLFLSFLDSAVAWASDLSLHLILDNHTFDPAENTEPSIEDALVKVWGRMAEYYNGKYENLYYEILNEPHGISDEVWGAIQQNTIDAIREHDQEHTIIVGGTDWNSFRTLDDIPAYTDDNLIYTFHFYEPFLFTHQGATWNEPTMDDLRMIPFPYSASAMPPLADRYRGTWIEHIYNSYPQEGNVDYVKGLIDIAADFREKHQVPVYCGEFGVYDVTSPAGDRVAWYKIVREYLEEKEIAWTSWDYHHGFGFFEKGSPGLFEHDLNVPLLEALGLNIPPQTGYVKKPDSTGFQIYTDLIKPRIYEDSYGDGTINYYAADRPNYGKYSIEWSGPLEYNIIGLEFRPDRDLSLLVSGDYFLDFFIRSTAPDLKLDVRFVMTDTSTAEHPWRNRFTVEVNGAGVDRNWHHIQIPLPDFEEHGAWEDGWFPPEGKFRWTDIHRLQISTEEQSYAGDTIWIDQMVITNQDTASIISAAIDLPSAATSLEIYPNPATSSITLYSSDHSSIGHIRVYAVDGKLAYESHHKSFQVVIDTHAWKSGMYFVTIYSDDDRYYAGRIIKLE